MIRRIALALSVLAVAVVTGWYLVPHPRTYTFHDENVMGTSMDLRVVATSEAAANAAEAAVLAQVDHDSRILSGYTPDSEFSRWFQTHDRAVAVSPELFTVLDLFDAWRARSNGALDAASERVSRVWKQAEHDGRLPSDAAIADAARDVRQQHWRLDAAARTATHLTSTPLLLNSFTKSYVIDRAAAAALALPRVRAIVVDVGGDIVSRGAWTEPVDVVDPLDNADNGAPMARLAIRDRAVATSGGYRRGEDIGGVHYSHIVDPRTGRPTSQVLSATVVAPRAVDAGALATAFCVLAPDESARLAAEVPGSDFVLVLADGRHIESRGWRDLESPRVRRSLVPSPEARLFAADQGWNHGFELTVGLELARPAAGARRPYVAVWIEDQDKFPIRTLALWFQKPRWLPELRGWYRDDRLRALAEGTDIVPTVSSATRAPGRYTFTWDGKDQQGKIVPAGTYTICVEVAREHGTYQISRQPMTLASAPTRVDLPANTEVAAAWIDYHKATAK